MVHRDTAVQGLPGIRDIPVPVQAVILEVAVIAAILEVAVIAALFLPILSPQAAFG